MSFPSLEYRLSIQPPFVCLLAFCAVFALIYVKHILFASSRAKPVPLRRGDHIVCRNVGVIREGCGGFQGYVLDITKKIIRRWASFDLESLVATGVELVPHCHTPITVPPVLVIKSHHFFIHVHHSREGRGSCAVGDDEAALSSSAVRLMSTLLPRMGIA